MDWKSIKPAAAGYTIPVILHRPRAKMSQVLRLVLDERPAPRLTEVARRLGYTRNRRSEKGQQAPLQRITENNKKSLQPEPYHNGRGPRMRSLLLLRGGEPKLRVRVQSAVVVP